MVGRKGYRISMTCIAAPNEPNIENEAAPRRGPFGRRELHLIFIVRTHLLTKYTLFMQRPFVEKNGFHHFYLHPTRHSCLIKHQLNNMETHNENGHHLGDNNTYTQSMSSYHETKTILVNVSFCYIINFSLLEPAAAAWLMDIQGYAAMVKLSFAFLKRK